MASDEEQAILPANRSAGDCPVAVEWINLSLEKSSCFGGSVKILRQLTGRISFGELTALMGPSGAGKTTLLRCINGLEMFSLSQETQILVYKKIQAAFISQDLDDHLWPSLTVKESLGYASLLKNSNVPKEKGFHHRININQVLSDLLLKDCCNIRVSDCSSGQQKRLTIGQELVGRQKPNLLSVDEPTSGLDSESAEQIMSCLQRLARRHQMAVVASVHQPNTDILQMIDHLYVLAKGGWCIFDGPPNQLKEHLIECQVGHCDWMVPVEEIIKFASKTDSDKNQPSTEVMRLMEKTTEVQQANFRVCGDGQLLTGALKTTKGFSFADFFYLSMRAAKYSIIRGWKNQLMLVTSLLVAMTLLLLVFPANIGQDPSCMPDLTDWTALDRIINEINNIANGIRTNLQLNLAFLFIYPSNFLFIYTMFTIFVFSREFKVFRSEQRNGWYSTASYYFSRSLVEVPVIVVTAFLTLWISYLVTNQPRQSKRFYKLLLFWLTSIFNCQSSVLAFSIILPPKLASVGYMSFMMAQSIFCDFITPVRQIHHLVKPFTWLSVFNLNYKSFITIIYGDSRCADESQVFNYYQFKEDDLWTYLILLLVQALFWKITGFLALMIQVNPDFWYKILVNLRIKKLSVDNPVEKIFRKQKDVLKNGSAEEKLLNDATKQTTIDFDHQKQTTVANSFALAWINLTYSKKSLCGKLNDQVILRQLNGRLDFGSMTALMGCSGAGKTTLLRCINQINSIGLSADTQIFVNNDREVRSCYIGHDQKQRLWMSLTVEESLLYSSRLKNSQITNFDHRSKVDDILNELLLINCRKTSVGRCSDGEQKRLSIGLELTAIVPPNLMSIDEPTSGIDSFAAETLIKCLKNISVNHQIAVLASIHQPNADVLMMFDRLYVLSHNGRCIFDSRPIDVKDWLERCGIACQQWQVPIEVIIRISSPTQNPEKRRLHSDVLDKLMKMTTTSDAIQDECRRSGKRAVSTANNNKTFSLKDFFNLTRRELLKLLGQWLNQICIFVLVLMAILSMIFFFPNDIGSDAGCPVKPITLDQLFFRDSSTDQRTMDIVDGREPKFMQNTKLLFFLLLAINNILMSFYIVTIQYNLRIFVNEHRNGWFATSSFFLAKIITEVPLILVIIYLNLAIAYPAFSEPDMTSPLQAFWQVPQRFALFTLVFVLASFVTKDFVDFFNIVFEKSFQKAMVSLVAVSCIFIFTSGFLVPVPLLSWPFRRIADVNFYRYTYETIIIIVFRNRCPRGEESVVFSIWGIDPQDLWFNFVWFVCCDLFFLTVNCLLIHLKTKPEFFSRLIRLR